MPMAETELTEEEIKRIYAIVRRWNKEVKENLIKAGAYNPATARSEFQELERLRDRARHNEASALYNVRQEEREKWQGVVAEKDALIAKLMGKQ